MKKCHAAGKAGILLLSAFSDKNAEKFLTAMGGAGKKANKTNFSAKPVFGDFSPGAGFFRARFGVAVKQFEKRGDGVQTA